MVTYNPAMKIEPIEVAIVANPYSGAGANRYKVDALAGALRDCDLVPRIIWDPAAEVRILTDPQWQRTCRCIVAAGGDGTIAQVLNVCRQLPLAVCPLGNENLLAKELGFMIEPARLAAAIARGQHRTIDMAYAGDRIFTLMVSAGFDAEIVHRVCAWRALPGAMRRVGHRSYMKPAVDATFGYRFPTIELEADGQSVQGSAAFVFNVPRYGLNLKFVPDGKVDDGLLHWVVFERPGRLRLLHYLWLVMRGKHLSRPDVRHGQAARVTLRSDRPVPLQTDGDAAGHTPVDLTVHNKALRIVDTAGA
jgi:diacylglycerol kinase family enzyme